MKRLIGAIDSSGKFITDFKEPILTRRGLREERAMQQRVSHAAELQQAFNPNGTVNEAYTTIYHEQAIHQGIIEEDAEPDFSNF